MLQLEHTYHLFALLLIPIFVVIFFLHRRWQKRAMEKFGDVELMKQLMPERSRFKNFLKFGLLMLVLVLLGFAYANPQMGTKKAKVQQKSIDIFIALDVSNSMLAKDISPNRLERSKQFCFKLINKFRTDRVGIILFAGDAYVQMPLTNDYATAQTLIKSASPNMVTKQGTAIGSAIQLAEESFDIDNKQHKALIVISDGENHEGDAITMAEQAGKNGMLIFTIGIGSKKSSPILITEYGQTNYKRNAAGEVVQTRLNEGMLKDVARTARGAYFKLQDDEKILKSLDEKIQKIEKREVEQRVFNEFETYFQWFVFLAIIILVAEFLISYRKSKYLKGKDLFR
ncbi:MAG: VWA domain-containing protein [Saprospiraceae bacterium]